MSATVESTEKKLKNLQLKLKEAEERAEKYRNDYNEEVETTQRLMWWLVLVLILASVFGILLVLRGPYVLDIYYPEPTCTEGILVQQYDGTWKEVDFQDYYKIVVTKHRYFFYTAPTDYRPAKYDRDEVIFMGCHE